MVERRSAIRAAVVWDAVQAVLAARSRRRRRTAAGGRRPRGRHRRARRPGRRARSPRHRGRPQPRRPRLARAPRCRRRHGRRPAGAGRGTVRGVLGDAATLPDVVPTGSADVVRLPRRPRGRRRPRPGPATPRPQPWRPAGRSACWPPSGRRPCFARAIGGHVAEARAAAGRPRRPVGEHDPMPRRFTRDQLVGLLGGSRVHRRRDPRGPGVRRPPQQRGRRVRARRRRRAARARGRGRHACRLQPPSPPSCTCSPPALTPCPAVVATRRPPPDRAGRLAVSAGRRHRLHDHPRRHGRVLRRRGDPRPPRAAGPPSSSAVATAGSCCRRPTRPARTASARPCR